MGRSADGVPTMRPSHQKTLILAAMESVPALSFVVVIHLTDDPRIAGWTCAILAAFVYTRYLAGALRPDTILLGINLGSLVLTPLVELLFLLHAFGPATVPAESGPQAILAAIALTGCVLTFRAKSGFLGIKTADRDRMRYYSLVLLAVALAALVWSITAAADGFSAFGILLIVLFGTRGFLAARLKDREGGGAGAISAVAAAQAPSDPDLLT
ncbi:MAG: hypothetical protein AAF390_16900 [Pseudomonadota bacterium]